MRVRLTPREAEVLREALARAGFRETSLIIAGQRLILDEVLATDSREFCADYLQEVGFDEDYMATEKGRVLESLIDKFFVP